MRFFWQLSYGNLTTEELVNQLIGYLNDWSPDLIIVQSGINDCRPEAFSSFQKVLIKKFSGPLFRYLNKHIHDSRVIKWRSVYRVTKRSYRKTIIKLKNIFSSSKIIFIEINAGEGYERARPGVLSSIDDYNAVINEVYPEGVISVKEKLDQHGGLNEDNLHLNTEGHRVLAGLLEEKINSIIGDSQ
jgi:lysophospholipase L1-like esterase